MTTGIKRQHEPPQIVGDLLKDANNGLVRVIGNGENHWPLVYDRDLGACQTLPEDFDGYSGLLNFGQAGFMAVGAYGFAISTLSFGVPFFVALLIAAAFMANPELGLVTALAIIAHEIPQEIGDFIVLLNAGFSRTRAYVYNLLCSLLAIAGGLLGYYTLDRASELIPYVLVFASSGFIYIAVSDLMPQMQRRATLRESVPQVLLIATGVAIVLFLTRNH